MMVQGRRSRSGRSEVGRVGCPVNYHPFVGKVSGHGRIYKEEGGGGQAESGELSKSINGVCTH